MIYDKKFMFYIVGCGGIGGNVSRDLPKLVIGSKHRMLLIDGDIVEESNTKRQPFQNQDIKTNKARALAKKINSFYEIKCLHHDEYLTDEELNVLINKYLDYFPVVLGCIDNDKTRLLLENIFNNYENILYIDGANSEYEGNIYVSLKHKTVQYGNLRSQIYELDNDELPTERSCERQIASGNVQFLITNNKIAAFMLEHIHHLITGQLKVGVTVIERFKAIHY